VLQFGKILSTKNTLSSIFWFSLLGFLRPAVSIFLLPLYLLRLTPEDYGVITMVGVITGIIGLIVNFRLDTAARTFYFDYNENEKLLWQYLSQIFSIVLTIGIFIFLLFQIVGAPLYQLVFDSEEILFHPYGEIALATILLNACSTIYFIYLKNKVMLKTFFAYSIFSVLLTIALQAFFILQLDMTILGVLWGSFIPTALVFLMIVFNNTKLLTLKISWEKIKPSILFGLPLIPFSFLYAFENQFDKIMLERYISLEQVGIYGILVGFVGLSKLLLSALDNGIRPFLYQSLKNNNKETTATVDLYNSIYIFTGLLALSGVIMIGANLHLITDNYKYLEIRTYIVWAAIATIPLFFIRFLNLILVFYKKSGELTKSAFIKTIFMIVLMVILIPKYGIYGAIVSISVSQIINFFLFRRVVQKTDSPKILYTNPMIRIGMFLVILASCYFLVYPISIGLFGLCQFILIASFLIKIDGKKILKLAETKIENK